MLVNAYHGSVLNTLPHHHIALLAALRFSRKIAKKLLRVAFSALNG
jgi:hypothetical protein